MADAPLLELADIETSYGQSRVLFGITLRIAAGEMVSLMGCNCMGKTTTVRSIMGLTPAATGNIRFNGVQIHGLPAYRIAKLRYDGGLASCLTVLTAEDDAIVQRRIVADLEARRLTLDAQLARALGGGFRSPA